MTMIPRRPLTAVSVQSASESPETSGPGDNVDGCDDWRAEAIAKQWAPEHQLIGALMHLPVKQVQPILDAVPDTAIWRPITRWSYELIRALAAAGSDPDPVLVLRRATVQSAADALDLSQSPSARRQHDLAVYLASAYTQVVDPHSARSYAQEVLDDAYRRQLRQHGARIAHMAESGAETADIRLETTKLLHLLEQWTGVSQTDIP